MSQNCLPAASYRCFEGRNDGWTPYAEGEFLRVLAEGGNVSAAARCVAMSLSSVYARRRDARRRGFAIAWEAALVLARDRLFDNLFERAIDGERFSTVKDGGETIYDKPNYRLGLGFLKHLEERQPGREAKWVADRFDEWLDALAVGEDRALRDVIEPCQDDEPWLRPWALKSFPLVEDSAKNDVPQFEDDEPMWWLGGRWVTRFPPPHDFDGEAIAGEPGQPGYVRTLSTAEAAIMRRSQETLEAEMRDEAAEALAEAAAARDAFFTRIAENPRGEDAAEDREDVSEHDAWEPAIEYKSMAAPVARASQNAIGARHRTIGDSHGTNLRRAGPYPAFRHARHDQSGARDEGGRH